MPKTQQPSDLDRRMLGDKADAYAAIAPPWEPVTAPLKMMYEAADARATAYNAYIFAPCDDMKECRRRLTDAAIDLSDSAAGWGTLTLDNARAHLVRAIALIDAMKVTQVDIYRTIPGCQHDSGKLCTCPVNPDDEGKVFVRP